MRHLVCSARVKPNIVSPIWQPSNLMRQLRNPRLCVRNSMSWRGNNTIRRCQNTCCRPGNIGHCYYAFTSALSCSILLYSIGAGSNKLTRFTQCHKLSMIIRESAQQIHSPRQTVAFLSHLVIKRPIIQTLFQKRCVVPSEIQELIAEYDSIVIYHTNQIRTLLFSSADPANVPNAFLII